MVTAASVLVERDVMVVMRDGTRLATDIYRPADVASHPVLLHRTPYGKSNWNTFLLMLNPVEGAQHGYTVIVQDCRGRFGSEGLFEPFANDVNDGYDALDWAAGQPWSDGTTGVYGSSGMGVTALSAAVSGHPSLKAAMIYVAGLNFYRGFIYSNSVLDLGFAWHWARILAADGVDRARAAGGDPSEAAAVLARIAAAPEAAVSHLPLDTDNTLPIEIAPYVRTWLEHPTFDEYWKSVDLARQIANLRVPLLHLSGWYDNFLRGHLDLNEVLRDHPSDLVRQGSRFLVGPWAHSSYYSFMPDAAGARNFGPGAAGGPLKLTDWLFEWFDHWLKNRAVTPLDVPPVRYFVMGENRWRDAPAWPPPWTVLPLYLHSHGSVDRISGGGSLDQMEPSAEPYDEFTYNPLNPVPSVGGRTLHHEIGPAGVQDQTGVEARDDVLVFTGAPLKTLVDVAGPVHVVLFASTDGEDTDFTAKLVDVDEAGFCANIVDGIVRGRYRNQSEADEFLTPDEISEFHIDCWDTAHVFAAGHSIRLEISSSNFPRYSRNLNIRANPQLADAAQARVARQRVYHDDGHPSRLELPLSAQASRA